MKTYRNLLLLLLIPLLMLVGWYAYATTHDLPPYAPARADFSALFPDTVNAANSTTTVSPQMETAKEVDTTAQRILFFGDSMVEGLMGRMDDYAEHNGHQLTSVVWYSSGTRLWAETDTLQHFLNEVRPSYVLICLGANQLFARNLQEVDKEIGSIIARLGTTPYVWVSPPNWKDDTGINELIIKHVGNERYFDSRHLTLARRRDRAHPTAEAAVQWCDTVCSWLSTLQPAHPIRMTRPDTRGHRKSRVILLQPVQ